MLFSKNSCLRHGEIDIWIADLDRSEAEIQHLAGYLSDLETTRAARFREARDSNRYAARHGILRVLLAAYMHCDAFEVEILSDSKGKPHVVDRAHEADLQFSMSHSAGLAVFAFGRSGGIGVDIERISAFPEIREFVGLNFTPAEIKELDCSPVNARIEAFFKLWVRKEAVLKASGDGLAIPLDRVDVSTLGDQVGAWNVCRIKGEALEREFRLTDFVAAPGFAAAVAIVGNGNDLAVTYRNFL